MEEARSPFKTTLSLLIVLHREDIGKHSNNLFQLACLVYSNAIIQYDSLLSEKTLTPRSFVGLAY